MLKFDANSEKALMFLEALKEDLDLSLLPEDLCLVIGGDGFLLRVIAEEDSLSLSGQSLKDVRQLIK